MSSSSSSKAASGPEILVEPDQRLITALETIAWSLSALAKRHGDAGMCDQRWQPYRPPSQAEIERAVQMLRNGA